MTCGRLLGSTITKSSLLPPLAIGTRKPTPRAILPNTQSPADASSGTAVRELDVRLNDDILYLGMTTSAPYEIAALRSTGANVTVVPATKQDHAVVGGRDFDLNAQALDFAHAIGLTGIQAEQVAHVLQTANPGSREELAEIARVWSAVERGGSAPSRLVLSGHSTGSSVYLDKPNEVMFSDLRDLAHAMPRGAGYVEDIELSGCNTGLNATASDERRKWTAAFPRLQTIWGYQGTCPMAPGSGEDMKAWERETRGRVRSLALDAAQIAGNVSIGSRAGSADSWVMRLPAADLHARLQAADARFNDALAGKFQTTSDAYDSYGVRSALYDDYQIYKGACARNDIHTTDKGPYDAHAEQLLRLRYWNEVVPKFASKYKEEINKGLSAARIACPDIATLSREKAVIFVHAFDRLTDTKHTPEIDRARELLFALRDLDPRVIERGWCMHDHP